MVSSDGSELYRGWPPSPYQGASETARSGPAAHSISPGPNPPSRWSAWVC